MVIPSLRLFARGNPVVRGRKGSLRLSSYTVLKMVDQYEALITEQRSSGQAINGNWKTHPLTVVSLIAFLLLILWFVVLDWMIPLLSHC